METMRKKEVCRVGYYTLHRLIAIAFVTLAYLGFCYFHGLLIGIGCIMRNLIAKRSENTNHSHPAEKEHVFPQLRIKTNLIKILLKLQRSTDKTRMIYMKKRRKKRTDCSRSANHKCLSLFPLGKDFSLSPIWNRPSHAARESVSVFGVQPSSFSQLDI